MSISVSQSRQVVGQWSITSASNCAEKSVLLLPKCLWSQEEELPGGYVCSQSEFFQELPSGCFLYQLEFFQELPVLAELRPTLQT